MRLRLASSFVLLAWSSACSLGTDLDNLLGGAGVLSCLDDAQLCDDQNACTEDSCTPDGTCNSRPLDAVEAPASQQQPGDCRVIVCSEGKPSFVALDDPPDDANDCTTDGCNGITPVSDPLADGTPCRGGVCTGFPREPMCQPCALASCDELGLTCSIAPDDGCGQPLDCDDRQANGDESDVDCGGAATACPRRCAVGQACNEKGDCEAPVSCTDSVCCADACIGECVSCAVSGFEGMCAPEPPATDPADDCGAGTCNGAGSCVSGTANWSRGFGDGVPQSATDVALLDDGSVVVIGWFFGTIKLDGFTGDTSQDGIDLFVAKFDALGEYVWSRVYGGVGDQRPHAVAVDSNGRVAVIGDLAGEMTIAPFPKLVSAGSTDVFAFVLDAAGTPVWAKRFGDSAKQSGLDVAFDDAGDVLLAGQFAGTLDFVMATLVANSFDGFVAKLSGSDGTYAEAIKLGGNGGQSVLGITAESASEIYVAGGFDGTLPINGTDHVSAGLSDVFVLRLDGDLAVDWSVLLGDSAAQLATSVSARPGGGCVVGVDLEGTVTFEGGDSVSSAGGADVLAFALDDAGAVSWHQQSGDGATQKLTSLAVDEDGTSVLTGRFRGQLFGLTANGAADDVFVVKLAPDGTLLWQYTYGDTSPQEANAVAASLDGVAVAGGFDGTLVIGNPIASMGGPLDAFLGRLVP